MLCTTVYPKYIFKIFALVVMNESLKTVNLNFDSVHVSVCVGPNSCCALLCEFSINAVVQQCVYILPCVCVCVFLSSVFMLTSVPTHCCSFPTTMTSDTNTHAHTRAHSHIQQKTIYNFPSDWVWEFCLYCFFLDLLFINFIFVFFFLASLNWIISDTCIIPYYAADALANKASWIELN